MIRDAVNQGSIPGPRYLANGKEIARRGGELTAGITAYADGQSHEWRIIAARWRNLTILFEIKVHWKCEKLSGTTLL